MEDQAKKTRPILRPDVSERDEDGFTSEMRALAEAMAHPTGDPYNNARELGFYCEQCG